MLKIFNNGKIVYWILGALWLTTIMFFQFDRSNLIQRVNKVEASVSDHAIWSDSTERSFRTVLIKINVKTNRILRELGYSDKEIEELEKTAILQP